MKNNEAEEDMKLSQAQQDIVSNLENGYHIEACYTEQHGYESAFMKRWYMGHYLEYHIPLNSFKALLRKEIIVERESAEPSSSGLYIKRFYKKVDCPFVKLNLKNERRTL